MHRYYLNMHTLDNRKTFQKCIPVMQKGGDANEILLCAPCMAKLSPKYYFRFYLFQNSWHIFDFI